MPKLKVLSGKEVVEIFKSFGFSVESQRGSHVKLVRVVARGKQVLGVPLHTELDKGTERAIYNQAIRYIPEEKLQECFYSK